VVIQSRVSKITRNMLQHKIVMKEFKNRKSSTFQHGTVF